MFYTGFENSLSSPPQTGKKPFHDIFQLSPFYHESEN